MTKKEIKNIVNQGFATRREKQKERNLKNSARTKAWKLRESFISLLEGSISEEVRLNEEAEVKRKKHYLKTEVSTRDIKTETEKI